MEAQTGSLPWRSSRASAGPVLGVPALLTLRALGTCRGGGIDWAAGSRAQVVLSLSVSCLQLNLSRPIEEQGPLDVIIHKLTDVILEADQNDSQSLELVHRFQVCGGRGQGGGGCAGNGSEPLRPWSCPAGLPIDTALLLPRRGPVVRPFPAGASVFGGSMGPLVPAPVCHLPLEIRFTDQGTVQSDHALVSSVHRWPEPQVLCWHGGGNPLATLAEKDPLRVLELHQLPLGP